MNLQYAVIRKWEIKPSAILEIKENTVYFNEQQKYDH